MPAHDHASSNTIDPPVLPTGKIHIFIHSPSSENFLMFRELMRKRADNGELAITLTCGEENRRHYVDYTRGDEHVYRAYLEDGFLSHWGLVTSYEVVGIDLSNVLPRTNGPFEDFCRFYRSLHKSGKTVLILGSLETLEDAPFYCLGDLSARCDTWQ